MVEKFFRAFPYLKPVRINNLFDRFLKGTNNKILIVYNKKRDFYEMHSLKSWMYNGESLQCIIPEDALNGWLYTDMRANDVEKFGQEIAADREFTNTLMDNYENKGFELLTKKALTTVEKMIGRDL